MWKNRSCCLPCILGSIFQSPPTADDANYLPGYIAWTEDGGVYFHIGSGQWIDLSGGGGGGGGVTSVNGKTGAVTITGTPPITVTTTGNNVIIGSTGGGGGGIQSIITDNGTATPNANGEVEIKGVSAQGTSTSAP